uniref:methyl-accepting chemotaxis protein n=2 Tax=Bacillus tuaregi TaxID=1816695 RepID=UPI0008F9088C|nr:methyl-accepting chemotaxis protein [Bacillus tuaregi]
MEIKTLRKRMNKNSIKVKLLFIPLIVVVLAITGIGVISSLNAKQSLINEMGRNGQFVLEQVINRLEDNSKSVEILNYFTEEDNNISASEVDELVQQLSYQSLVDDLATSDEIVYALFTDKNLQVTAHSIEDRIGLDLSEDKGTISAVKNGEIYTSEYLFGEDEIPVYDIVYPAVINGEQIGAVNIGYSMENINSTIKKNLMIVSISGVIGILLLGTILFSCSNYAIKTINKLKELMNFMATGNFSNEVPEKLTEKTDEFGEISRSVNDMQNSVRGIIKSILGNSQTLASHSEQLKASTQYSTSAANEVSQTIEMIASGAINQAKDAEKGFSTITELGEVINENAREIKQLNKSLDTVNQLKMEGIELILDLVKKTEMSNKSSVLIKEVIGNTSESAKKIAVASEMIKSIAEQTNLLALNAAIEAARAGEAGKGFAVVADEIRKLAEQSNQFTKEISTVIDDLSYKSSTAVQTMEEVKMVVDSQTESVKATSKKFEGISESIEDMKNVINTINKYSSVITNQKENIAKVMEQLSAISQENASGTQEVTASVEEQTAAMQEIASSSEELSNIAQELNKLVEQFKV